MPILPGERMNEGNKALRIAAVGDLHVHEKPSEVYRSLFTELSVKADVVVLCGDLTHFGTVAEAENLAADIGSCSIPVVGVLGNHDYQSGHGEEIKKTLRAARMIMLEDEGFEHRGVGFAGVKGFAGGFNRHMLTSFGEEVIKAFVNEAINEALKLENALRTLNTSKVVVALHYSPVMETLKGEPLEIYPFLGSSRLAETIDSFEVDLVFHGHAHKGTFEGKTHKGVPVYNCCLELMSKLHADQPYALMEI
jgi:Icc-related predicted phosphoesterase